MWYDHYHRVINYARIAITDRCNLRCTYCMSENPTFLDKQELLSYEEILRILKILSLQGIKKIRYTGGEPFVRKDFMQLLQHTVSKTNIQHISITTNGVFLKPHIEDLKKININAVNVSLDSLNEEKLFRITKRNILPEVYSAIETLLYYNIPTKVNVVVMENINDNEIVDFIQLTKTLPINVRFIEEMPFNHQPSSKPLTWDYLHILEHIKTHFDVQNLESENHSTSRNYKVKNFVGSFGVIPAYSRTFCNTCNRIRITPQGFLKTCLYEKKEFPLLHLLRNIEMTDTHIAAYIKSCILQKPLNGFEAERQSQNTLDAMNRVGG